MEKSGDKHLEKRVAFHNLGCKVNSYELDIMRQILRDEGFEEVSFQEEADIYVVNTCTVTNIADRKSRVLFMLIPILYIVHFCLTK